MFKIKRKLKVSLKGAELIRVYYNSNKYVDLWLRPIERTYLSSVCANEYKCINKELEEKINLAIKQNAENRKESMRYI